MKKILKSITLLTFIVGFISCEYDKDPVVSANGFELRKDETVVSPNVLLPENNANNFAKFEWDVADNGPATVSSYKLEVLDPANPSQTVVYSGSGFVVTPESRQATLTVQEFNNLLGQLETFKCSEMSVQVRIKSTLGGNASNALIQYSNPININVTGYSTKLPIIAFVLDGSNASEAQQIKASNFQSNSDYEGYMYLEAGSYKFYKPNSCGDFTSPMIYGGSAGTLDSSSSPTSITISNTGHYLVKANLETNTYTINQFTTFGVFGRATRQVAFGNQVPLDYDATRKVWTGQVALFKGYKFKFKSNLWTGSIVVPAPPNPPYAPGTASTAVSILGKTSVPNALEENNVAGSGDITVPGTIDDTRDTYKIELDLSKPRQYTYTMTKL